MPILVLSCRNEHSGLFVVAKTADYRVHGVLGAVTAHTRRLHYAGGVPETFVLRLRGLKAT